MIKPKLILLTIDIQGFKLIIWINSGESILSVKVAVLGCGLWGKNLVRNFHNLGVLYMGCDIDRDILDLNIKQYPNAFFTDDFDYLLNLKEIDAVVIATPSHTHYNLVKKALESDKHVYVEKPVATNSEQAMELTSIADERNLILMVGHLLLYHPAVNRLKSLIKEGVLGKVSYIQSDRLNINHYKNDRNVMWDLAPHDISMIGYITDSKPQKVVSSVGFSSDNSKVMDIIHMSIDFESNIRGHVSNSWIHPCKRVQLLVRGTLASAVLDDTQSINKIHIYEHNNSNSKSVEFPDYIEIEPLKLECQHFINCIKNNLKPRSDGINGYEVVKIIENAEKIMLGSEYQKINSLKFASSRKECR